MQKHPRAQRQLKAAMQLQAAWSPEPHELGFRVEGLGFRVQGLGFRVYTTSYNIPPVMENQMEKKMENEMEALGPL